MLRFVVLAAAGLGAVILDRLMWRGRSSSKARKPSQPMPPTPNPPPPRPVAPGPITRRAAAAAAVAEPASLLPAPKRRSKVSAAHAAKAAAEAKAATLLAAAAAAEMQAMLAAEAALEVRRQEVMSKAFLRVAAASHLAAVEAVVENEHARPGTPLFKRWQQAWEAASEKGIELVFHGTPDANVDAILRSGLDPALRGTRNGQGLGPGEYFALQSHSSVAYCRGGRRLLVFAVLSCPSGITARSPTVLVLHKPEHHLPLFTLVFRAPLP